MIGCVIIDYLKRTTCPWFFPWREDRVAVSLMAMGRPRRYAAGLLLIFTRPFQPVRVASVDIGCAEYFLAQAVSR